MPIFLARRGAELKEIMDDPDCDLEMLNNTYRQFRVINVVLSRAKAVYKRCIRPAMQDRSRGYSLLDIGFGGGDIPIKYAEWATRDRYKLHVTGIEIDARAFDYVKRLSWPANVSFRLASVRDLIDSEERFDFVVSNHMLHHLHASQFHEMLDQAARLSRHITLFVDVARGDMAYALFACLTLPLFRDSFIRHDGLISIRRSYTFSELLSIAPRGWQVKRLFPFRLLLSHARDSQH
ncbi:MAG: methyltransferase domain-containing protein [Acidiferrobacterales bacterium]